MSALRAKQNGGGSSDGRAPVRRERKKAGIPWTPEEHQRFLLGLSKLGRGDWRGISRHYVQTRTPTQVASHAQKYFIRQSNVNHKRKRRTSLFDTTLEALPTSSDSARRPQSRSGSLEDNAMQESTSGQLDAEAPPGKLPVVAMPVGILANAVSTAAARGFGESIDGAGKGRSATGNSSPTSTRAVSSEGSQGGVARGGLPVGMFPFGMLPQFASLDPSSLALLTAMHFPGFAPFRAGIHQLQQAGSLPSVLKPMAIRYTDSEVLQFKSAAKSESNTTQKPRSNKEAELREHIEKVYRSTSSNRVAGKEEPTGKPLRHHDTAPGAVKAAGKASLESQEPNNSNGSGSGAYSSQTEFVTTTPPLQEEGPLQAKQQAA